jgi:hypothetical protein
MTLGLTRVVLQPVSRKRMPLSSLRRRRAITIDLRGWQPRRRRRWLFG